MIQIKTSPSSTPPSCRHRSGMAMRVAAAVGFALWMIFLFTSSPRMVVDHGPVGIGKINAVNLIAAWKDRDAGEVWLDGRNVAGIASNELIGCAREKMLHLSAVPSHSLLTAVGIDAGAVFPQHDGREGSQRGSAADCLGDREHHVRHSCREGSSNELHCPCAHQYPRSSWADEPTGNLDAQMKKSCCACCANPPAGANHRDGYA